MCVLRVSTPVLFIAESVQQHFTRFCLFFSKYFFYFLFFFLCSPDQEGGPLALLKPGGEDGGQGVQEGQAL